MEKNLCKCAKTFSNNLNMENWKITHAYYISKYDVWLINGKWMSDWTRLGTTKTTSIEIQCDQKWNN